MTAAPPHAHPRLPAWLALVIAFVSAPAGIVPAGDLVLTVTDENSRTIPCRVLLHDHAASGDESASVTPDGATVLKIGPQRWFMSDGHVRLDLRAGRYDLRIECGTEFRRFKQTIDVPEQGLEKTVRLERWVNMRERGYLCGENHVHRSAAEVGPMAIAEGLDFASSMTWWNGPDQQRPVPPGDGPTRRLRFADREITATIHDAELEYAWGAAYIQHQPQPLPIPSDRSRPNLFYLQHAVDRGAMVHYQGGWSREVGLDALLGLVHVVNVCNNNYHLHRYQPRTQYSNLLEVDGFPVYPDTEAGMLQMNTDTYYRLLNWGLKLPAGAGSATGAKQTPVGYNRAYVRCDADATLEDFNENWKAGRNFVTNGPVILLNGPEGTQPGDEITLTGGPHTLDFILTVLSDQPLQTIEFIQNGQVVQSFPGDDQNQSEHRFHLEVDRSAWLAARCTARDDLLTDAALARYDNPPLQRPSRLRFAHTSPIYITLDGQPATVRRSVEEGLQMLDRLQTFAEENAAPDLRDEFSQAVERGREILRSRL
ncbi:MAG: CehA/McbA family metallohydrolase [Planctomycetaceae bacterium]